MRSPLTWLFRRIYSRYDSLVSLALPQAWKQTRPPLGERIIRYFFGAPFSGDYSPESIFWRWAARVFLAIAYIFFLWFLAESFMAWNVFSGD